MLLTKKGGVPINLVEYAKLVCVAAHAGQVDRGGKPYFLHPFAVAREMKTVSAKVVAYLHDILEDTGMTESDLSSLGLPREVVAAVQTLSHPAHMPYPEYIERVKTNKLAVEVKIADLKHNMDLSRIVNPTQADKKRVEKYSKALDKLNGVNSENISSKN